MIVLSLFDGMACGYEALKRAGIYVEKYYASEIDKYAIEIANKNHPDIIQLGDVENWQEWDIETPDLIIGGSPCQGFSFAGKQLAFDDPRSQLFFTMMDIIDYFEPEHKLLENVRMKKEHLDVITEYMGVEPHFINSTLVSAQNRQRYYWYNWSADDPKDENILLKDIVHADFHVDRQKSRAIIASIGRTTPREYFTKRQGQLTYCDREKSYCIDANYYKGSNLKMYLEKSRRQIVFNIEQTLWRKLTPVECERLQTLPDNYTDGVSNTQRYKMIGNGWTVDVISHLFNSLPLTELQQMMRN